MNLQFNPVTDESMTDTQRLLFQENIKQLEVDNKRLEDEKNEVLLFQTF